MDRYRFTDGVYVYFVTFTVKDWLPIFINPEASQIIIDSLQYSINTRGLRINAYVIMPNHLHMIVFDKKFVNSNLKLTLTNFRKFTGRKLANHIDNNLSDLYSISIRRKSLEDRFRQVWQPGWHAKGLLSEDVWIQKMNYIHEDPVRMATSIDQNFGGILRLDIG